MKIKQSWKSIKLIARRQYPKIIYLVMSGSAQAIEPTHEQLLLDSAIDHSAAGRAFKCDPYAWIHTSGFAQRYGMGKRWLDHSLNSVDPARGSNATINKTKSLDWVWLTAIGPICCLVVIISTLMTVTVWLALPSSKVNRLLC